VYGSAVINQGRIIGVENSAAPLEGHGNILDWAPKTIAVTPPPSFLPLPAQGFQDAR
jgi:hypothetical protein